MIRKVKEARWGLSLWGEFISKDWDRTGKVISVEEGTEPSDNSHPNCHMISPLSWPWDLNQCPWDVHESGAILSLLASLPSCVCPRAVVHIQVKDVNEFAPTFKEPAYKAIVTEGKIYDSILQVEAIDEDCSPQYSQICNYEIVTTDVPFAIDRNGECP